MRGADDRILLSASGFPARRSVPWYMFAQIRPRLSRDNEFQVKVSILLVALMLAPAPPMFGHHSFAAEYGSKPITLKGTIVRFVWMNPHTRIYLDVTSRSGAVAKWECEGSAPGGLLSNGWSRESLRPGDRVTIEGFPAKDRPNACKTRAVKLADGRRLMMD
jgi:hypothetical protein